MTVSVTLEVQGMAELRAGMAMMADPGSVYTDALRDAGMMIYASARTLAPSGSGSLSGSIGMKSTNTVADVGAMSPYARWFHVPGLSAGGVTYAKKVSSRGRSYGQRIPDNPFMINAAKARDLEIGGLFITATGQLIDQAMAAVPRG